jgi:hypothetical protein
MHREMTLSFKKNIFNKSIDTQRTKKTTTSTPTTTTDTQSSATTITSNNQDSYLNGIGSYEFIKSLGSGKFSRVMLAYHLKTHQQVAIKVTFKSFEK